MGCRARVSTDTSYMGVVMSPLSPSEHDTQGAQMPVSYQSIPLHFALSGLSPTKITKNSIKTSDTLTFYRQMVGLIYMW